MHFNPILRADSYKMSHFAQYPQDTCYMFSYLESRGGAYGYTRFFGLQYYLMAYLQQTITTDMVEEAKIFTEKHGVPFPYAGWMRVATVHKGKLPLRIRALPEGCVVQNHTPLLTIESTDPELFWLVGWAETLLLKVWYPITVATFSFKMRGMIERFLQITSDHPEQELPFKLHDFGCRGVSSEESAGIGGMAHLVNFSGSDTMIGGWFAQQYYDAEDMPAYSVPASEHSTMTSWGAADEVSAYRNLLITYKNYPIVSIVVDSYDFYQTVAEQLLVTLKTEITQHQGLVVIRPDSGDALSNIRFILKHAEEKLGVDINQKGYKVLKHVRILQGDGVHEDSVYDILNTLCFEADEKSKGWSAENFVFGCGGALLQGNAHSSINRDTHKFAIKCSAIMRKNADGTTQLIDVYKNPITDQQKRSKRGRLDVITDANNQLKTISISHLKVGEFAPDSAMQTVFLDGKITQCYTFSDIRKNDQRFKHQFNFGIAHL